MIHAGNSSADLKRIRRTAVHVGGQGRNRWGSTTCPVHTAVLARRRPGDDFPHRPWPPRRRSSARPEPPSGTSASSEVNGAFAPVSMAWLGRSRRREEAQTPTGARSRWATRWGFGGAS